MVVAEADVVSVVVNVEDELCASRSANLWGKTRRTWASRFPNEVLRRTEALSPRALSSTYKEGKTAVDESLL